MAKKKKVQSYYIDEDLIEVFDVITTFKRDTKSDIINNAIRDYVIRNKASINEYMAEFWKKKVE